MIISQVLVLKVGSPGHRPHTEPAGTYCQTAERHFQCPRSPHFHQHGILTASVVFANINLPGDLKLNLPDDSRCISFGYHWDCYHHVFIDWIFQVPAVCLHLPLLFCGCRILCGWEPGSHWKWRSSSRRNASLCSATTIPVQVHAGCVLFTAGLQGSWSALLRIMCLNFRFGTEAGKHWKCLLFCSLGGRIRVRNSVWIPSFGQVLSGSVLLLQGRVSS